MLATMVLLSVLLAAPGAASDDPAVLDRGRIQRHLARVEAELRAAAVGHLPPTLRTERARNLDRLRTYRLAGRFPRNSMHPGERVPYFIDDDGVACAVGHLVIASGFAAVAEEIRDTENNARLLAMNNPALPTWIAASGLTADECARIQPEYCACSSEYEPVCGSDGKTYFNACYAEQCAFVSVAHKGVCGGTETTSWPAPGTEGEDATGGSTAATESSGASDTTADTSTPGTTGSTGIAGSSGADTTGSDAPTGSETGSETSSETGPPSVEPPPASGCRMVDSHALWLVVMLAGRGRRRRR